MKTKSRITKLFSIIVSAMMMVGLLATTVLAAPGDAVTLADKKITVTDGENYLAYKVLNAKMFEGSDAYEYEATTNFASFFNNPAYLDGNDKEYTIEKVANIASSSIDAKHLGAQLAKFVKDLNVEKDATITDGEATVSQGYYLLLKEDANGEIVVPILVNVKNSDVEIDPKNAQGPTIEKDIDVNGTLVDANGEYIGKPVNYKIQATVPTYDSNVDLNSIEYYMTDTLSAGLTYQFDLAVAGLTEGEDYSVTVKQDGIEVDADTYEIGKETTIVIDFQYESIKTFDKVVVTYSAILNEYANIGEKGNPNDIELTYTSDPSTGETHTTDKDKVITYTYGIGVLKVDEDGTALDGAEFTLEDSEGNTVGKYIFNNGAIDTTDGVSVEVDENGVLYFLGLDEGDYKLKETVAPSGYVLLKDPITFSITADKNQLGQPIGTVVVEVDNAETETKTINVNGVDIEVVQIKVVNIAGFNLPTTGGAGTWMFTIAGLLLMAGATVVFVSSRKKAE